MIILVGLCGVLFYLYIKEVGKVSALARKYEEETGKKVKTYEL